MRPLSLHPSSGGAWIGQGCQHALELHAQVLVVRRKRETLTEVLRILVGGEARADRRDLEKNSVRLAEVDRPEIEAVDDRGWAGPGINDTIAPCLVLVHR